MRVYTALVHPVRAPALVREGWSLGAAAFGPLWFAVHRVWFAAAGWAVLWVGLGRLGVVGVIVGLGLAWIAGLVGWDLVRWSLGRRGYVLAHVVAGRDAEAALARLLAGREDLAARYVWRAGW